jgi:hypothetical protein
MTGMSTKSRGGVVLTVCQVLAASLSVGCRGTLELAPSDHEVVLARQLLDAPNPAKPGPHPVLTLFYGGGQDRNRPEYRDSVTLVTDPVDASKLVDLADEATRHRKYWGFGPDSFPVNGRVWYPEGTGPFPLVLVVHGNHNPRDFSDPGYGYLGELLASRGFILASVDENFINGSSIGNDVRGWMLLKHLEAWRDFNSDPGSPFRGKVDLGKIALMGHSRGGEAVGVAGAFNRLRHYPDDASLTFDFDFDIRSLVAIAPVDGQYLPADQRTRVRDVNYLVLHGSHDGDVTSFHGIRLWKRVDFVDGSPRFKSAVYVYRANHGQWNTVWGRHDSGPRSARILDLRGLLAPEEQREFGKLYISAFLEATLKGDERYLPMFRDHRVVGGWLPPTMYVTRFQDSTFRILADFDEDIDVTTGTEPGVRLRGDSLSTWREGDLKLRSRNRTSTPQSQFNQAVWLGWNNRIEGAEEGELGAPTSYSLELPEPLARSWELGPGSTLDFALTALDEEPAPREREAGEQEGPESAQRAAGDRRSSRRPERKDEEDPDEPKEPVDLTVELMDGDGRAAEVRLSRYGPVRRPLEMKILRRRDLEDDRFDSLSEMLLQSYSIPLEDFVAVTPELDLSSLATVRFVFDVTEAGTVVLDELGFSNLDPAFLEVRIP